MENRHKTFFFLLQSIIWFIIFSLPLKLAPSTESTSVATGGASVVLSKNKKWAMGPEHATSDIIGALQYHGVIPFFCCCCSSHSSICLLLLILLFHLLFLFSFSFQVHSQSSVYLFAGRFDTSCLGRLHRSGLLLGFSERFLMHWKGPSLFLI